MVYLIHASNRTNEMEISGKFINRNFADMRADKLITEMPKGQHYTIENKYDQIKVFYDENIIETFKIMETPDNEFAVVHYDDLTNNIEMCFDITFATLEDAANALVEEIESTSYYSTFEEKDDDDNLIYGEYEDEEGYAHVYKVIGK